MSELIGGDERVRRWVRGAGIVGVVGLAICAIALTFDAEHALRAYLWAWLFCLAAALGAMCAVMLHHLTGGWWGWPVRRAGEAAAMTLPLLLVMFIPIAIGARWLFPWAQPEEVAKEALLQHRRPVFDVWFTILRSFVYLVIWSLWAWRLRALSLEHDRTGDPRVARSLRRLSAIGFVVYFATMSLAGVDWVASREVNWYSTTFGLVTCLGQAVTGVAFVIVVAAWLVRAGLMSRAVARVRAVQDVGNLLLTVVVLWSYVSFAQYLVIWMGDTQEDNRWFTHRLYGRWWYIGLLVILLHFALPFVLLLFQRTKQEVGVLARVAIVLLFIRAVNVVWEIDPSSLGAVPNGVSWLDFISPIGVGGVWLACFAWWLGKAPLVPAGYRADEAEAVSHDGMAEQRPLA